MSENSLARLLEWNKSWVNGLNKSIAEGDYAKVIDLHFKNGLMLLSAMKNIIKNSPENSKIIVREFEDVRSRLMVLSNIRKTIDRLKDL